MRFTLVVLCLVSTNALALDFNTEWNSIKSRFTMPVVVPVVPVVVKQDDVSVVTPVEVKQEEQGLVDPKSPDRLGYKLSDPEMRKRVIEAYNKPDAVVYSYTLR